MTSFSASALLTDAYHFSMIQAYLDEGMSDSAVFELFVRKLPRNRNFLVAAGLEQVLEFVETLRFSREDLEWLRSTGRYRENLLQFLETFRFSGDIWAMPEGSVFFENEPILRVKAPLPQAQLLETRVLNLLHFQTVVASKAARSVLVARGKTLVDFGLRRAHGAEAGLLAARASYVAGFDGTSTVQAGKDFGIPVSGTMAHSFIEAHSNEASAFEGFARSNPENVYLLLDTYDTANAARIVARVAPELQRQGIRVRGVRLDSGDLAAEARRVREILDGAGCPEIRIFASGGIDESEIEALLRANAPIDGFGVGTHMTTSEDAPFLDCAYKLEEYAGRPRWKLSIGKATYPGAKQVFRFSGKEGNFKDDFVALESESSDGEVLLFPFMKNGKRIRPSEPLSEIRARCTASLKRLPSAWPYPVRLSPALLAIAKSA